MGHNNIREFPETQGKVLVYRESAGQSIELGQWLRDAGKCPPNMVGRRVGQCERFLTGFVLLLLKKTTNPSFVVATHGVFKRHGFFVFRSFYEVANLTFLAVLVYICGQEILMDCVVEAHMESTLFA
jgi:hypothetical protein